MAVKIRLRQQGRKNLSTYRLVVIDSRNKRDGKYVESLGWYNPIEESTEKKLLINEERILHWVNQGAILTEKAKALVAQAAPQLITTMTEKELARRSKEKTKRKARQKARA